MLLSVTDRLSLTDATRTTRDGYLLVDARIARAGIQEYLGSEMGRPDLGTVRVYRPENEVFSQDAMSSFIRKPVTNDHPREMVTAATWKDTAVGMTGDEVVRDGDYVRLPFMLTDQSAIDAVLNGKRELSAGYTCDVQFSSGSTPGGEVYDAVMSHIVGNHLAVVDRGRAGHACRIGDAWTAHSTITKGRTMPDNLRTVIVDGLSVQTTDQGAQAIDKLLAQIGDASKKLSARDGEIAALTDRHANALSAKDAEIAQLRSGHDGAIAAKDQEIADLRASVPDAAAMDALIEARSGLISVARKALGDSYVSAGRSNMDIRRDVLTKRLPAADVAAKDEAWVNAAFEALTMDSASTSANVDPLRQTLSGGLNTTTGQNVGDTAHNAYTDHLQNAWRGAEGAR